jgi:hypothetical protein
LRHHIVVVDDAALDHDWALIETNETTVLAVKDTAMNPRTFADAWAAYRMLDRAHTPCRQPSGPGPGGLLLQFLHSA